MTILSALVFTLLVGQPPCPYCGLCPQVPADADLTPLKISLGSPGPLQGWMGGGATGMDVVFVSDGYMATEQALFNEHVQDFIDALMGMYPFDWLSCTFNFYRVNVISGESGIDYPHRGSTKDNALNSQYGALASDCPAHSCECDAYPERYITSPTTGRIEDAAVMATNNFDIIVVVANDTTPGGGHRGNGVRSIVSAAAAPGYENMIRHEFCHSMPFGHLADEYGCFDCDTPEDFTYDPARPDPTRPNLTKYTDVDLIKWGDLIDPVTPLPTHVDSFAVGTPPEELAGVIGAWEGAGWYAHGLYRPQMNCLMRTLDQGWLCKVCRETITSVLKSIRVLCPPGNVLDRYDLTGLDKVMWLNDMCVRYPLPGCPTCTYDESADTIEVAVEFDDPAGQAAIEDQLGRVVAEVDTIPPGTVIRRLTFVPEPNVNYRLTVCFGPPLEVTLAVRVSMWINGHPVTLP